MDISDLSIRKKRKVKKSSICTKKRKSLKDNNTNEEEKDKDKEKPKFNRKEKKKNNIIIGKCKK